MKHLPLIALCAFLAHNQAHAFGGKKMKLTEVSGKSEAQIVKLDAEGKMDVMIRGRTAELFYKMSQNKPLEIADSEALTMAKGKPAHWSIDGQQMICSKIANEKTKKEEFACGFEIDSRGVFTVGVEPFAPAKFNLAQTAMKSPFFHTTKTSRGLASASNPYDATNSYVMYEKTQMVGKSKLAMVVIRGKAAQEIIGHLEAGNAKKFQVRGVPGVKGKEVACVYANGDENERCSFVVSMADGSITSKGNPLLQ